MSTHEMITALIEQMSRDARAKRFDRLANGGRIQDAWDLYESLYKVAQPVSAMTPDNFVFACACETVHGHMPRMTCPCCGGTKFDANEGFTPFVDAIGLRVAFFCRNCGFSLGVQINFGE